MGSIIAVKNEPVAMHIKAIEGFAHFIAAKKSIQCNPISIPIPANRKMVFRSRAEDSRESPKNNGDMQLEVSFLNSCNCHN